MRSCLQCLLICSACFENWVCGEGDPEVVGVVAMLATVKNDAPARVLAEFLYTSLGNLVVKTGECTKRLAALMDRQQQQCPDILPFDQVLAYQ